MADSLAKIVKKRRKALGLRQSELAKRAEDVPGSPGFSQSYISALERGVNKEPGPEYIAALAAALEISEQTLILAAYGSGSDIVDPSKIGPTVIQSGAKVRVTTGVVVEFLGVNGEPREAVIDEDVTRLLDIASRAQQVEQPPPPPDVGDKSEGDDGDDQPGGETKR